jgi:hypothetical protein
MLNWMLIFVRPDKSDKFVRFVMPTILDFTENQTQLSCTLGVPMTALTQSNTNRYWTYALWLVLFMILYNLAEGMVSVFFGFSHEALTLFGFGVDSFIEVMSRIGILAMVIRIRHNPDTLRSQF